MLDTSKNCLSAIDNDEKSDTSGGTRTPNIRFRRPMHENDNALINKELIDTPPKPLQTSLQKDSENGPIQADSYPPELLRIAKVWDNLPEHIREAIQALVKPFSGGSD